MFILDMTSGEIITKKRDEDPVYPDEVLDSEWNPVLPRVEPITEINEQEEAPTQEQIINSIPYSLDGFVRS